MKQRAASLFLVSVLCLSAACKGDPEVAKQKYLASGDAYFKEAKYREAVVEYANAVQRDSQSGEARLKLADAYMAAGDTKGAFPQYVRAADLLPDSIEAQNKAGRLLVNGGFFEDAKNRARAVLKREPGNVEALLVLGNALAGLKNLGDAVGVLNKAVEMDPERAGVYTNLAIFEFAQGDQAQAEAAFVKATASAPTSAEAHLNLGTFYRVARRYVDSERSLKRAYELEPKNVAINQALASLYVEASRPALAEPYLKNVVAIVNDAKSRFAIANFYIATGRYPAAVQTFEELAKDKATYGPAKTQLALLDWLSGRLPEANRTVDEILTREPRNAGALTLKGRLLLAAGRPQEALTRIKTAVEVDPRLAAAQLTLARIELASNHVEEARRAFNETLKLDPSSLAAQLELSELHRTRREIETAIQFAEQAIRNHPNNLAARLVLVRALTVRDEDYDRADRELKTLVARRPDSAPVYGAIGQVALAKNDLATAGRAFERAIQLDPASPQALAGLVAIDISRKNSRDARARVEAVLAKNPNAPGPLLLAAKVYRMTGDLAKMEDVLNRALKADPSNPDVYGLLGQVYLSQGKIAQAKKEYGEITRLQPRSVPAHTMMGLLCYVERDLDGAQKWWEKALQIDANAAAAANNLAWLYANGRGNLDVALALAQTAKSSVPDSPDFNDTLGWVYYKKDLPEQAIVFFQLSVEKDPTNPDYHYHLGMAYANKGEDGKARRELERALALKKDFDGAAEARKTLASLVF
jgi:tetratricopeptide (TPR) repeat protein